MIKPKLLAIIFVIVFILGLSVDYIRIVDYGLYGSKEIWEKTEQLPPGINYPYGISESDAISKYGDRASDYIKLQNNLITVTKQMEANGFIKCYPEQNVCHYTGKGMYPYGEYSKWAQSSELTGWLAVIITNTIAALILTLIIYTVYEAIQKFKK